MGFTRSLPRSRYPLFRRRDIVLSNPSFIRSTKWNFNMKKENDICLNWYDFDYLIFSWYQIYEWKKTEQRYILELKGLWFLHFFLNSIRKMDILLKAAFYFIFIIVTSRIEMNMQLIIAAIKWNQLFDLSVLIFQWVQTFRFLK